MAIGYMTQSLYSEIQEIRIEEAVWPAPGRGPLVVTASGVPQEPRMRPAQPAGEPLQLV